MLLVTLGSLWKSHRKPTMQELSAGLLKGGTIPCLIVGGAEGGEWNYKGGRHFVSDFWNGGRGRGSK